MKTWRYDLPNDKPGEGWARIILTSSGLFAAVSDWGNYACQWGSPGVEDFREFFLDAETRVDYFVGKLCPEKVLNEAESWKSFKKHVLETRRRREITKEQAREVWGDMDLYSSSWEEYKESSSANEVFDELWDFDVKDWNEDALSFVKRVLPRLAKMLKAELANGTESSTILEVKVVSSRGFSIPEERFTKLQKLLEAKTPLRSFLNPNRCDTMVPKRDGRRVPEELAWEGTPRTIEYFTEALKAFDGRAEVVVVWSNGAMTGYKLEDHKVVERPVKLSLG